MVTIFRKASPLFALFLVAAAPPGIKIPTPKGKHSKTPGKLPTPAMASNPKAANPPPGKGPGFPNDGTRGINGQLLPPRPVALPNEMPSGETGTVSGTGATARSAARARTDCRLPVEAFLKIPVVAQVRVGADGATYFLSNATGLMQLYRTSGPGTLPSLVVELKEGIRRYELDRLAKRAALTTDVGGDEQFDLYVADLTESHGPDAVRPLWVNREVRIESFHWRNDTHLVATANARNGVDMDLYEIPAGGGAPKMLAPLVGMNEITDVRPDGGAVALERHRSALSSQILLWDGASAKITAIAGVASDEPAEASRNLAARFTADGKGLLWLSDRDGEYQQLYQTKLPPDGHPLSVTHENGDVEWVRWSGARKTLLASVNIEGGTQLRVFEPDKNGVFKATAAPNFGDRVVASADLDDSGPLAVTAVVSTFDEPPRLSRWKAGKFIDFPGGDDLPAPCRTPIRRVRYTSFDGLSIPAFLAKRSPGKGKKEAAEPFLVYVHGGPEAQFRPEFQRSLAYLASLGMGILAPNVRGSTGYGKKFTRLDDYKLRMDSVKDVIAGSEWLLTTGHGLRGKLAIYGGSYGGFLVLRSIEVEPELYSAAAEAVGIADFVTFLRGTKSYRRELREREYGPLSDELFLKSISPMTYLDRIRTPLLVFHGARDPRVPVEESQRLAEQLRGMGRSVELKVFTDAGHGSHRVDQQIDQTLQLGLFLERWLVGDAK